MTQLLDPARPETRVELVVAVAEVEQRAQWRAAAATMRALDDVLAEAQAHPEVWVDAPMLRGDAVELAVRAAVADLAVRLNIGEGAVRGDAHTARTLRGRMPQLWSWFRAGEVSTPNAREAAAVVIELPAALWERFDAELLEAARTLAPARFRTRARALRERLHPAPLQERRKAVALQRRVWSELDRDGMGWLHAYLPAEGIARINAQVDSTAFGLFTEPDETRTMGQLRADVLTDLLVGDAEHSRVSVAITIPALALLGGSDELAVLEGVGPVDLETARRLAGDVPSITRLFTDPVTEAVLQLDPRQYRPSAALKRWIGLQQPTCDFPGCGRRSADCDLDHTTAHAAGGQTAAHNLAPRCRKHHTMKHQTKWRVERSPGGGEPVWTSPTGHTRASDPPPF